MVFLELKRRASKLDEIYYWNAKFECDFLIKHGTKIRSALQVCYQLDDKNINREVSGLVEAMDEFKLNEGIIITDVLEETRLIKNKKSSSFHCGNICWKIWHSYGSITRFLPSG